METAAKVKGYLQSKGFTPTGEEESLLTFQDEGGREVVVALPSGGREKGRNGVLKDILYSTRLTRTSSAVYLALPKPVASALDSKIFEEQGIGLLTVGERGVDEAVPPRPSPPEGGSSSIPTALREELSNLRADYHHLRESVHNLQSTLHALTRELESLRASPSPRRPVGETGDEEVDRPLTPAPRGPPAGGTPSFLRDNPWLEVLAQRGKEPQRYVS